MGFGYAHKQAADRPGRSGKIGCVVVPEMKKWLWKQEARPLNHAIDKRKNRVVTPLEKKPHAEDRPLLLLKKGNNIRATISRISWAAAKHRDEYWFIWIIHFSFTNFSKSKTIQLRIGKKVFDTTMCQCTKCGEQYVFPTQRIPQSTRAQRRCGFPVPLYGKSCRSQSDMIDVRAFRVSVVQGCELLVYWWWGVQYVWRG